MNKMDKALLSEKDLAKLINKRPELLDRIADATGETIDSFRATAKEQGEYLEDVAAREAFNKVTLLYCEACYVNLPGDEPDPYVFFAKYGLKYSLRIRG